MVPRLSLPGDHEGATNPGHGSVNGRDDERFPFAGEIGGGNFSRRDQLVDQRAFSQGAGDDDDIAPGRLVREQRGPDSAHALEVSAQVSRGAQDAGIICPIQKDRRCSPVDEQRESIARAGIRDEIGWETQAGTGGRIDNAASCSRHEDAHPGRRPEARKRNRPGQQAQASAPKK